MKLLEHKLDLLRRDAAALVDDLQLDRDPFLPAFDAYRRLRRRIFGGVVEEIEQHLLEKNRIKLEHRQVGRNFDLHCVSRQDLPGPLQDGADDLANIVTRQCWA